MPKSENLENKDENSIEGDSDEEKKDMFIRLYEPVLSEFEYLIPDLGLVKEIDLLRVCIAKYYKLLKAKSPLLRLTLLQDDLKIKVEDKSRKRKVRVALEPERVVEFKEIKETLGVFTEADVIRHIIHQSYVISKSEDSFL